MVSAACTTTASKRERRRRIDDTEAASSDVTLSRAVDAYLATLRGTEEESTRRVYGRILRRMIAEFGGGTAPDEIGT